MEPNNLNTVEELYDILTECDHAVIVMMDILDDRYRTPVVTFEINKHVVGENHPCVFDLIESVEQLTGGHKVVNTMPETAIGLMRTILMNYRINSRLSIVVDDDRAYIGTPKFREDVDAIARRAFYREISDMVAHQTNLGG